MNILGHISPRQRVIITSALLGLLLIWLLARGNHDARSCITPEPATTITTRPIHNELYYGTLIALMDRYNKIIVNGNDNTKYNELMSLLTGFRHERRRFYDYLIFANKKDKRASERKKRSLSHYIKSIEHCIRDLELRLKNCHRS